MYTIDVNYDDDHMREEMPELLITKVLTNTLKNLDVVSSGGMLVND